MIGREERLTYWKCPDCRGLGEKLIGPGLGVERCMRCDGTGNGLVDGEARQMKREIEEVNRRRGERP